MKDLVNELSKREVNQYAYPVHVPHLERSSTAHTDGPKKINIMTTFMNILMLNYMNVHMNFMKMLTFDYKKMKYMKMVTLKYMIFKYRKMK